ncbi:MAG: cupredoxin family copper-binding protein [Rhizobiaceae bacterium]|nr:cupredoxin family copper-binding protein [Rhizobiaceae bacterium]
MRISLAAAALAFATTGAFAADHAVEIKGMKFNPAAVTVKVGDTITFTNADAAPHTATADDKSFDTGRLSKGQSATVTISAAGDHAYKCLIHTMMKGSVKAE